MSDFADTLWPAFAAETAEHLSAIEPLLVGLAGSATPGEDVRILFRAFHSVKGIAAVMARYAMEAFAHRAESLLGLIRDRGAVVTDETLDALLAATDELRRLRVEAIQGQPDAEPSRPLIARMEAALAAIGGDVTPAVQPQAEAAPIEPLHSDGGLGGDPEMLALYVEVLAANLPVAMALMTAGEDGRGDVTEALETLSLGAGVLELTPVADLLRTLGDEVAIRPLPLDTAGRAAVWPMMLELTEKAALLAELGGDDAVAAALSSLVEHQAVAPAGEEMSQALATLADAMAAADDLTGPARYAREQVSLWTPAASAPKHVAELLRDILPRLEHGTLPPSAELAGVLAAAARADLQMEGEAAGIAAALRQAVIGGFKPDSELPLHGPLVAGLDGAQRQELAVLLASGHRAYALLLFLEDAPVIGARLLAWLPTIGRQPFSRSVFAGTESWFEMLLLTPLAPEALRAELLQLDPERACLRELRLMGEGPDVTLPVDSVLPQRSAEPSAVAIGSELRIPSNVIDRVMEAIVEARTTLEELSAAAELESSPAVRRPVDRLEAQLRRLQVAVLETRIVAIDAALRRLPRAVRSLAREQGKEIELVLEGREVRVDKVVVDRLVEPLMHMIRNAVDHGIETPEDREQLGKRRSARLWVQAVQEQDQIALTVGDDGRGLDRAKIAIRAIERGLVSAAEAATMPADAVHRLIFTPGFSTAAVLTETSGRGVGMDVVLTEVHRLGGEVAIETEPGQGTRFTLRLPLTAAARPALLVRVEDQCLAIPEAVIARVATVPSDALPRVAGRLAYAMPGSDVPLLDLRKLLWPGEPTLEPSGTVNLVVVQRADETVAFAVDEILRRQELLLVRLHPALANSPFVGGAAVLGDGEVVLLLDPDTLMAAALEEAWGEVTT